MRLRHWCILDELSSKKHGLSYFARPLLQHFRFDLIKYMTWILIPSNSCMQGQK